MRKLNGVEKLNQEYDIINVVKDLRVSKFLNDMSLASFQKQLIQYYGEYLL